VKTRNAETVSRLSVQSATHLTTTEGGRVVPVTSSTTRTAAKPGDAAYADNVNPGDELMLGPGKFVRVLDVVPVDEEGSRYVGFLKVEPAE
jgi:hypothetical protein